MTPSEQLPAPRRVGWSGSLDLPAGPVAEPGPLGGLGEFDLGTVPASVTPPRSSRRAAWFAVAASGAVLGGLLLATAALVSPARPVEGLHPPAMPRGDFPEHSAFGPPLPHVAVFPAPEAVRGAAAVAPPPAAHSAAPEPVAGPAPAPAPPAPAESAAPAEPPLPEPSFRPELLALADPQQVADRSGAYFDAVRDGDLHAAYELTTGELRADGYEAFAARYAGAERVEVLSTSASSTGTVTALRITRDDGTVVEQRRRLRFTPGEDPMVYADEAVGRS